MTAATSLERQSPDEKATLVICPPHPRRIYLVGRVMGGAGVLAIGVLGIVPSKGDEAAKALNARRPAGSESGRLESWPGLEEKIATHRRALGSRREDCGVPQFPSIPTPRRESPYALTRDVASTCWRRLEKRSPRSRWWWRTTGAGSWRVRAIAGGSHAAALLRRSGEPHHRRSSANEPRAGRTGCGAFPGRRRSRAREQRAMGAGDPHTGPDGREGYARQDLEVGAAGSAEDRFHRVGTRREPLGDPD